MAIVQMLERMKDMATERNTEITRYHLRCTGESASLKDKTRATALMTLSEGGFQLWEDQHFQAKFYKKDEISDHPDLFKVYRNDMEAEPRIVGTNRRCNCEHRVSMLAQCRHEICVFGFRLDLFGKRYHQQSSLAISRTPVMEFDANLALEKYNNENPFNDDEEDGAMIATTTAFDASANHESLVTHEFCVAARFVNGGAADGEAKDGDECLSVTDHEEKTEDDSTMLRAGSKAKSSNDYRTYSNITSELWDTLKSRDLANSVCRLLLKLKDFLRTNEVDNSMTLDDWLNNHLSCFAAYRSSGDLFARSSGDNLNPNGESQVGAVALIPRTAKNSGAPRTVRLKPNVETRLLKGSKASAKCTFCKQTAHKKNNCPEMAALNAKLIKSDKLEFYLGNPEVHQVLTMPNTMASRIKDVDFDSILVPMEAVHVVLNAVYKHPYISTGGRHTQRDPQEDLVDATFLGESGRPLPVDSTLYKVKFLRQWISRKSNRMMIFTKLHPPTHKVSNDYVYI